MNSLQREFGRSLRRATTFSLDPALVTDHSDSRMADQLVLPDGRPRDPKLDRLEEMFRTATTSSLASIPREERTNRLNGVTGHIAESVVASILSEQFGYVPPQQMVGPESGGHGVDLLMMTPDLSAIVSVEVKGTLQQRRWPRLTAGEVAQMTDIWLDKPDNPGMDDHDLSADDVFGAVILVNFPRLQWKCAVTNDFVTAHPVISEDQLADLAWLEGKSVVD